MSTGEVAAKEVVRLLLVRHGEREGVGGEHAPLTARGSWQASELGRWLEAPSPYRPDAILCSHSRHAQEHAGIVSGLFSERVPVVPVTALTPHTEEGRFNLATMRLEAAKAIEWGLVRNVTCIGHEPRLGQLAHAMTGTKPEGLEFGELLCVEGDSWEDLEAGRGRTGLRTRVGMEPEDENELLPKVQSKMQTSALLAGFTSTVFGVVLTQSDYWTVWTTGTAWPSGAQGWRAAAIAAGLVCLAVATLLFVVSIYMYDRLAMPRRYWAAPQGENPLRQERWGSFRRDRERCGLLYAYMIWVWRFVFSVAVVAAMLGFLALVLHRGVWPVTALFVVTIAASVAYYVLFRPELGID